VEWVVAAQRVTLPEPARADVHGWADGILVGFQVREGSATRVDSAILRRIDGDGTRRRDASVVAGLRSVQRSARGPTDASAGIGGRQCWVDRGRPRPGTDQQRTLPVRVSPCGLQQLGADCPVPSSADESAPPVDHAHRLSRVAGGCVLAGRDGLLSMA